MTTTTVRVSGPQDLLAYIPYRLGFRPVESLVVVSLRGRRQTVGLVSRVDLAELTGAADDGGPGGAGLAGWLAEHALADGATRAVVVVYTSADVGAVPACPERRAVDLVRARLDRSLPGTEAWVVGPSGYRAVDCPDPACCPAGGRPLTQVAGSRVVASMVLEGRTIATSREARYAIPSAPVAARTQASRAALRWEQHRARLTTDAEGASGAPEAGRALRAFSRWGAEGLDTWRRAVRQVASAEPGRPVVLPPVALGRIAAALADRWVRDAILVSLLPGSEELASATARRLATAGTDVATGEVIARIVDQRVGEEPDPAIVGPARAVLEAVVAHVPRRRRAAACTLLALLAWWDGDGGSAAERVREALATEPDYPLAKVLAGALNAAVPPGWVRRRYREDDRANPSAQAGAGRAGAPG
ncbi:DUF4192 domain-containing protein [Antribacter sp. KLBMP9083]|uniref:DUF4192 domain-containing protein n=1 Tax=Antribacter soli TaxID=2910976 RepID=A0AA41U8D3_9MICO|nr:DUF4192 domain-containing protein [Antribacter soli]MCF4122581.1 DUF4192 domain-containing protein [Antribacter soli]